MQECCWVLLYLFRSRELQVIYFQRCDQRNCLKPIFTGWWFAVLVVQITPQLHHAWTFLSRPKSIETINVRGAAGRGFLPCPARSALAYCFPGFAGTRHAPPRLTSPMDFAAPHAAAPQTHLCATRPLPMPRHCQHHPSSSTDRPKSCPIPLTDALLPLRTRTHVHSVLPHASRFPAAPGVAPPASPSPYLLQTTRSLAAARRGGGKVPLNFHSPQRNECEGERAAAACRRC